MERAIAAVLHLFVIFAFFTLGLFFVLLPYLPLAQERSAHFLMHRQEDCTLVGILLFAATFVLLIGFLTLNRGRTLRLKMGTEVDAELIRQTLEKYFEASPMISLREVQIPSGSRLEIGVSIAPLEEDAREALFVKAEEELQTLLKERFGYSKPFHLVVKL
jgi:hypothetical protein